MVDAITAPAAGSDATSAAAAAAAAAAPKPWFDGKITDNDTIGYLTNKGWHNKTVDAVALEATRAHRELEKHIGVPANELIRVPKTPVDPLWKDVYAKLGVPSDPAAYKFDGVKMGDQDLPQGLQDFFRKTAVDLHLTAEGAKQLAAATMAQLAKDTEAVTAEHTAKLANEKTALAKNWGANAEVNKLVASKAAQALGVTAEVMNALEASAGYAATMEMFRQIGERIGEDKFVRGSTSIGGSTIMTVDAAAAKHKQLMADPAWVSRYLAGGHEEKAEMTALNTILVGSGRA